MALLDDIQTKHVEWTGGQKLALIGVGALVLSLAVSFAVSVGTSYLWARWALKRCGRCG